MTGTALEGEFRNLMNKRDYCTQMNTSLNIAAFIVIWSSY
jgi:hypothetical protein